MAEPFTIREHTAADGYVWRYRHYSAGDAPRGAIVFVHGIQSHGGWYVGSCTHLAACGYEVSFLDRRGSGLNTTARGDAPSFRRLLDDVAEYLTAIPRSVARGHSSTRLPLYLAGISWGGKLAVAMERRHPGLMDGLILMCPGFFPRVRPTLIQRLGIIVSRLIRPRSLFTIPLNDPELFTAVSHWQEFLRNDALALHRATSRLLLESVRIDGYLRFVPKYVHVPVLLMLAQQDRIINNKRTRAYVDRFATPDKTVLEYANAQHTLEFAADPAPIWEDLCQWLEKHA